MSESDILQAAIQSAQAATALFSLFFAIVSAYIAGLYFFLNSAPFGLRLIAFVLLTISFLTVAALAFNLQYLGEGMHNAWQALPQHATGMERLGPPVIVRSLFLDGRTVAMFIGWSLGAIVYISLAYMTFLYCWPQKQLIR
jgi:hypothetical protein